MEAASSLYYGEVITTKAIWDSLSLNPILNNSLIVRKRMNFDYPLAVFIMLLNRLIAPKSKLALTRWQERIYIDTPTYPKYQHYLRALEYLAKSNKSYWGF